ncbi:hypothetical protein GCM10020254_59460 [Streptomyces goshikiensis]
MGRRKRAAWILNLVVGGLLLLAFAVSAFTGYYPEFREHAQNWVSLVLTAAFVGALVLGRHEFYAKGDRSNPKLAVVVAAVGLLITSLVAALLVGAANIDPDASKASFMARWKYGVLRLVTLAPNDVDFKAITTPGWVDVTVNVMSMVLLLAVLFAAFRSRRAVDPLTEEDEDRLRALLAKQGDRDSLGYFALRREKSVIWSPTGKAAVTYRVVGGVSLASGDPIGDPEAWPGAIEPWLAEAREHGWVPAVMGGPARKPGRSTPGTAWTRWSWATRRSSRPPSSPWRAAPCGPSARRSTGSSGPATPSASAATRTSPARRWTSWCAAPTTGATARPSAASRWRWADWATPPTASA